LNQVHRLDGQVPTVDVFSVLLFLRDAIYMHFFDKHLLPSSYLNLLGDLTTHFGQEKKRALDNVISSVIKEERTTTSVTVFKKNKTANSSD